MILVCACPSAQNGYLRLPSSFPVLRRVPFRGTATRRALLDSNYCNIVHIAVSGQTHCCRALPGSHYARCAQFCYCCYLFLVFFCRILPPSLSRRYTFALHSTSGTGLLPYLYTHAHGFWFCTFVTGLCRLVLHTPAPHMVCIFTFLDNTHLHAPPANTEPAFCSATWVYYYLPTCALCTPPRWFCLHATPTTFCIYTLFPRTPTCSYPFTGTTLCARTPSAAYLPAVPRFHVRFYYLFCLLLPLPAHTPAGLDHRHACRTAYIFATAPPTTLVSGFLRGSTHLDGLFPLPVAHLLLHCHLPGRIQLLLPPRCVLLPAHRTVFLRLHHLPACCVRYYCWNPTYRTFCVLDFLLVSRVHLPHL